MGRIGRVEMGTAEILDNEYQKRYAKAKSLQSKLHAFMKSYEGKEVVSDTFAKLCKDPDKVCTAVGPDGIQYPFDTNMLNPSAKKRGEIRAAINGFDDLLYRNIGRAIETDDAAALGMMIIDHAKAYLMKEARDLVEEQWRDEQ